MLLFSLLTLSYMLFLALFVAIHYLHVLLGWNSVLSCEHGTECGVQATETLNLPRLTIELKSALSEIISTALTDFSGSSTGSFLCDIGQVTYLLFSQFNHPLQGWTNVRLPHGRVVRTNPFVLRPFKILWWKVIYKSLQWIYANPSI